ADDREILREFVIESTEGLDRLEGELMALEREPESSAILTSIFRTFHTIKGTCGFFGFARLQALTHAAENLLSLLRDEEIAYDAEIASTLLASLDACRKMLSAVETTGNDGAEDWSRLIEQIQNQKGGGAPARTSAAPVPATTPGATTPNSAGAPEAEPK